MKEITVLNNQSLFDISVQEYGTIEAVFELAQANDISVTANLVAGQRLVVPGVDKGLLQPDIVDYYKRNDIHPVSGNYDLSLFTFEQQNFDDMRLLFSWGLKDYDGTITKVLVDSLHTNPHPNGEDIYKYLLRVQLSDPEFLEKVDNPVLLIDRRRRKVSNSDTNSLRRSGYTHPKKHQWNDRVFEIPITSQTMMLDLKNEHHFDFSGKNIVVPGCHVCSNQKYAYTDIAFRIRYSINGIQKETGHIGKIRLTAQYAMPSARNNVILSYRRV